MSSRSVDPEALAAVVRALEPLRSRAADAEEELLPLTPDVGDPTGQAAADAFVDAVLDAVRALGEEARLQALALRTAATGYHRAEETTGRSVEDARWPR